MGNLRTIAGRLVNSVVTVTTAATALPATAATGRVSLSINNVGSNTIYVGGASVTAANGYPVTAGGSYDIDLKAEVVLYAITASATSEVRVLEGA